MWVKRIFSNFTHRFTVLSLTKKITIFIYLTSLLLFLAMGVVIYLMSTHFASKAMISDGTDFCGIGTQVAENACSYLKGVADYCGADRSIQQMLMSGLEMDEADISSRLFFMIQSRKYVLNILIYNTAGQPLQYMTIDGSSGPLPQMDRPAFRLLLEGTDYAWEFIDTDGGLLARDNSPKLSLWRLIRNASNRQIIGAVCVSIDSRLLLRYETPYTRSYHWEFSILDSLTGAAASDYSGNAERDEEWGTLLSAVPPGAKSGCFPSVLGGQSCTAFYQQISSTPLYVFYLVFDDRLAAHSRSIRNTIAAAAAIYLLLILPVLTLISRWLTEPLAKLTRSMDQFSEGDFSIRLSFNTDDEIGRLGKTFNKMVEKNRQLIEQTYVAQIKAKEAELLLLQAQINPHFIYNLINSIQWSALRYGQNDIADTAYSLGQIFRISLNRGSSMITVRKECELVNCYLTLQKARYKDRIGYSLVCDEAAREIIIPKLIIQPLVENCIVHGAESSMDTTTIQVRIKVQGDLLVIEVEDNGAGIPPDVLANLPDRYAPPDSSQSSGFAIKNIYDRLKLLYDQRFTFHITSGSGQGTYVRITLCRSAAAAAPAKKEEQNV